MESSFYGRYKRMFLIGLGVLLGLTCLALAKYNTFLGVFGFVTLLVGLYAFYYVDQQEHTAREQEIREEFRSMTIEEREGVSEEKPVSGLALAFLQIDDHDEVLQGLVDEQRPLLAAAVDKFLQEWAETNHAYLYKDGRERYIALLSTEDLENQENQDFTVLNKLREIRVGDHIPVTMSIGAAKGVKAGDSVLLGQLAQQALELSLERGGDQAVVKSAEHTWFYGGDT
ncbi:MAG TPA: hypothetical protein DDY25_03205, partial [Peptococcaceae bacterium]|nr:hypothetical protein [Peptococcaceae bacterium]